MLSLEPSSEAYTNEPVTDNPQTRELERNFFISRTRESLAKHNLFPLEIREKSFARSRHGMFSEIWKQPVHNKPSLSSYKKEKNVFWKKRGAFANEVTGVMLARSSLNLAFLENLHFRGSQTWLSSFHYPRAPSTSLSETAIALLNPGTLSLLESSTSSVQFAWLTIKLFALKWLLRLAAFIDAAPACIEWRWWICFLSLPRKTSLRARHKRQSNNIKINSWTWHASGL